MTNDKTKQAAARVIGQLATALQQEAGQIAGDDPFQVDQAGDEIIVDITEFLLQASVYREDGHPVVRLHQLSEGYIAHWFSE